jgi:hypothetical protein
MARPGRQERNRTARSFRQLRRFHHVINSDKVFGTHRDITAIIDRLVGDKKLPTDVMAEIVERTDGIPLFVEEMTNAVLEADSEGAARRTVAAVPSPGEIRLELNGPFWYHRTAGSAQVSP